jgi:hypothetical protein
MGKILTQGTRLQQFTFFHPLSAAIALAAPLCFSAAPASAEQAPEPPSLPGGDVDEPEPPPMDPLQAQMQELTDRLKEMEEQQVKKAASPLTINGYVDFGGFVPFGNNGRGYVEDLAQAQFPEFKGKYGWTFLGDILSTAVNSRGEVADLGQAAGLLRPRFDSIHSNGAAGFILNEFNLRLGYALTDRAILRTSVNFVPRSGTDFALGDFIDVDQAEMEYVVTDDGNTSVWAGKILPVFGIEYKERKSDQRFGITPSLIQRYTSGPQLGLKVRSKLLQDWLIVAGSVTNNSSGTEQFHFQSEIDKNNGKTLNGRLALNIPIGDFASPLAGHHLEIGASGEWGPQDWASDTRGNVWFGGLDLQYLSANFMVKAQAIRGHAPGDATDAQCRSDPTSCAWHLDLHTSGYVEVDGMVTGWLGFMLRAEQRDAFVALGMNRLYLTKERRYTGAVRVVFSPHIILKVEYLLNREYGGIAQFENNILTSSLVLAF